MHATGQMCNQFWIFSNAIADAIENGTQVEFLFPNFNLQDFPHLKNSDTITFYSERKSEKSFLLRLLILYNNALIYKIFSIWCLIKEKKKFLIQDVTVKKSEYKFKHLESIKRIFLPAPFVIKDVEDSFEEYRQKDCIIIGMHFRRGDYKTFENGKYYYSDLQYANMMEQTQKLFSSLNRKVIFFIASNEKISPEIFKNFSCFLLANGSPVKDMWGLANCDYILGPPSTFSAWASLYNRVPIYFIEDINKDISFDSFYEITEKWF